LPPYWTVLRTAKFFWFFGRLYLFNRLISLPPPRSKTIASNRRISRRFFPFSAHFMAGLSLPQQRKKPRFSGRMPNSFSFPLRNRLGATCVSQEGKSAQRKGSGIFFCFRFCRTTPRSPALQFFSILASFPSSTFLPRFFFFFFFIFLQTCLVGDYSSQSRLATTMPSRGVTTYFEFDAFPFFF